MVRTADTSLRVAGGKSTRKGGNVSARQESLRSRSPSAGGSGDRGGGLNPVCPRETPSWQKPITTFFTIVDKSQQQTIEDHNKPGSSSQNVADVNMLEIDNQNNRTDPQSNYGSKRSIEAMDEEFHEFKIDKTGNNKENETNTANMINSREGTADTEMEEISGHTKKKVNARDDVDEELVPSKRIKLDKNIYEHLQELEQS